MNPLKSYGPWILEALPSISASKNPIRRPISPGSVEAVAWGDPLFGGELSEEQLLELREARRRSSWGDMTNKNWLVVTGTMEFSWLIYG